MHPNLISNAAIASVAVAATSMLINTVLIYLVRRQKLQLSSVASRFDEEVGSLSHDLDIASKHAGDNARRIAWLETRVRSTRRDAEPVVKVTTAPAAKPTITERRHRVLTLARRGQDVTTIARTLGMNDGEVELMINLGRAA
jgi:hypothetical protein